MTHLGLVEMDEPALAAAIRRADSDRRRWMATQAAELALRRNGLLVYLPLSAQDADELEEARAAAEEAYWDVHGGDDNPGPEAEVEAAFMRERALTAACAVFFEDATEAAAFAIYETMFAVDDREALRAAVGPSEP